MTIRIFFKMKHCLTFVLCLIYLSNCQVDDSGATSGLLPEPVDKGAGGRTSIVSVKTKGLSCITEYNVPCIYASNKNSTLRLTFENLYHRRLWVAVTLQKPNQVAAHDSYGAPLCDSVLLSEPMFLEADALVFRTEIDMSFFMPNSTQGMSQVDYYFCLNSSHPSGQWVHQGDVKIKIKSVSMASSYLPPAIITGIQPLGARSSIAPSGGVNLPANADAPVLIFGFNFTSGTIIRFTTQKASRGDRCDDFKSTSGFLVNSGDLTDHSAKVTVNLPEMSSGDEVYYMCVKESELNGEIVRWYHQGYEDWMLVRTEGKLLPLWLQIAIICVLLGLSGLFSGLNLGLMALDRTDLKIIENTGSEVERRYAKIISPVRQRGNYLLCTLLLGNVLVNNSLTILLDDLTSGVIAVIGSTLAIVIFGEIVPQAICSRHGLLVGAHTVWITKFFMLVTFPLSFPISLILDKLLGNEIGNFYNRDRLKELIRVTHDMHDLQKDEINIISGALELTKKTVAEIMTKLDDVFMIPSDTILNFETMSEIMKHGYTRIPVFEKDRTNIVGMLMIKDLAFIDPDDNTPVNVVYQFYKHEIATCELSSKLSDVFEVFKTGKSHMAFVQVVHNDEPVDPYHEVVGVVTLEDVIEEIIQSEINDETDVISDNRRRLKRMEAQAKQDFSSFLQQGDIHVHISPQLMLAAFQYLSTSVDPFMPGVLSPAVLKRLLRHDIYVQAKPKEASTYIYERGKPADYFVLILEGRVSVTIGKESLVFQCGPFTYFGAQILGQQTADGTSTPTGVQLTQLPTSISAPSSIPSVSSPGSQLPLASSNVAVTPSQQPAINASIISGIDQGSSNKTFVPDYTVEVDHEVLYIRLKRSLYLSSLKATMLERHNKLDPSEDLFNNMDKLQSESMERLTSARSSMRSVENLDQWKNSFRSILPPYAASPLNTGSPTSTTNRNRAFSQPEVSSKPSPILEDVSKASPPSYEKSILESVPSNDTDGVNRKIDAVTLAIEEDTDLDNKFEVGPKDFTASIDGPPEVQVDSLRKRYSNTPAWPRSDSSSSPMRNGQPTLPPDLFESNL